MVIECGICQSRYHMRESMMRGFPGAEVRCRKCGGIIVVTIPAAVTGSAGPASPDTKGNRLRHRALPPGEQPGIPAMREDSSPESARRGPPPGERTPQPRTALAEKTDIEESVPDNVYSLEQFRELRPRKVPEGGFDISGSIRPEPTAPLPESEPDSPPTPPSAAPLQEEGIREDSTRGGIVHRRVAWEGEGILPRHSEVPALPSKESRSFRRSFFRKGRRRSRALRPMFPKGSDIALVYFLLLLAGGLGYLVVRLLVFLFSVGPP